MLVSSARRSIPLKTLWKYRFVSLTCRSHSICISLGDSELKLSTGELARFASGAVVASQGDNAVLATCVYRSGQANSPGFVPLTVDFKQSAAAVGRIPTNYLRRELGQSDADILASRIIDRALRPLLPKEWKNETQIICKPLSLDDDGDGVLLGINAAVAAIHVSSVPFYGPVGAVRLGLVDGKIMVNPSRHILRESKLDMVLAGCGEQRTVMIEMDGEEISLDEVELALNEGFKSVDKILSGMNDLREISGKKKEDLSSELYPLSLVNEIRQLCDERLYYILTDITRDKTSRDDAIKEIGADVLKSLSNRDPTITMSAFSFVVKQVLR